MSARIDGLAWIANNKIQEEIMRLVKLAAAVVAIFGISTFGHAAIAETCDTPLPDDLAIQTPAPDISKERIQFLGVWGNGKWDGVLCNTLLVQDIDAKGNVKTIYSWGTYNGWDIWEGKGPGGFKFIADNKIQSKFRNGAVVTYWIEGKAMKGTYVRNGYTTRVTLVRK
ncbi:MAG: hypothetical protein HN834_11570 [Rhodospirillaceae bacterium]|nr:hypothetical protein [Rhodospirillaceae bacterium]